ncbi:TerB family tellurite resistance protein [Helicobacter sp. NHP22-001]|uniref:TerB family tellurite resistance protein n=1 Tax=Helicobacter sp. NHP22-001 TaxID=3040202 RepID=UPI00244D8EF3|nr:TerB family tellurite resistance protein [Helicobacter sp. NHP22-001]GMB96365.1 TerB domain-containing protein [Helicobacter sp. NHP22-001]
MLEVVLVVGVAVVLIYLYYTLQEYLKNPLKTLPELTKQEFSPPEPHALPTPLEVLKSSEAGLFANLMGVFSKHIKETPLSQALSQVFLQDLSQVQNKDLDLLTGIYKEADRPLEELCHELSNLAHGEYKKRVKWVELLFVLAYSDGVLGDQEREALLDIGAFLGLENADFNQLYEGFAGLTFEPLESLEVADFEGFKAQVQEKHLNLLDPKKWNKSYLPQVMLELWQFLKNPQKESGSF